MPSAENNDGGDGAVVASPNSTTSNNNNGTSPPPLSSTPTSPPPPPSSNYSDDEYLLPPPLPSHLSPTALTYVTTLLPLLTHVLTLYVYLRPILASYPSYENVLDEIHIANNPDVLGDTDVRTVFGNDYWGRPMHAENSHRSWRPLSILSFRYLRLTEGMWFGGGGVNDVLMHRIVNVILHAGAAEMVSSLFSLLFVTSDNNSNTPSKTPLRDNCLRALAKLCFAFHPTHVEAVANGANRPHVLAVLFSLIMVDYRVNLVGVVGACLCGLLASETAIFQIPPVLVTMTVVMWKRSNKKDKSSLITTMTSLLPRYFIIITLGLGYYFLRYFFDTLSIPEGLIRPAENPFYEFTGLKRILSYTLILSIHIGKSVLIDLVGFSHEYGYNCVKAVEGLGDTRLVIPQIVVATILLILYFASRRGSLEAILNAAVGLSWYVTLFPISGIIKVGTFIADRIVVASTISFALFAPLVLEKLYLGSTRVGGGMKWVMKPLMVGTLLLYMSSKVTQRTTDWMTSVRLLESSLVACPDSAKSNLEISKLYSGMLSQGVTGRPVDLDKAMEYLTKAETIDPDYCDIHQQIAGIHFQRQEYPRFEDRLTRAILCPFTMQGAASTFRQYWQVVTQDPRQGVAAQKRYQKHMARINKALEEAKKEEQEKEGGGGGGGRNGMDLLGDEF